MSPAAPSSTRLRFGATVWSHSVVDFFSFVGVSLLPLIATRLELDNTQKAIVLGIGPVASGGIQPVVAWISDKTNSRLPGVLGMLLGVLCVSCLGFAENFWQLVVLTALGTMGIGAYHPPAAAACGQLSRKRSLGMAIFFLAGMLGGMAGNIFAPQYVDAMSTNADGVRDAGAGLHALTWFIPVGLVFTGVLLWAIQKAPHRAHDAHERHRNLAAEEQRRRWHAVWLLYAGNVVRFTSNNALIYLLLRFTELHAARVADAGINQDALGTLASEYNGPIQAAQQLGMGGAGLLLGASLAPRLEKPMLVATPVLGALAIAAVPWASDAPASVSYWIALALSVTAGVGFGSMLPVTIGMAQRLLPHRTSLASGLMLGGAWGFAFIGPITAERIEEAAGLKLAHIAVAGFLLLAAGLATLLPGRLLLETADD
ncbi:MAG: MFS transporter [Planctomycetota bacterium]